MTHTTNDINTASLYLMRELNWFFVV